jgi:hypothetical protein
MRIQRAVMMSFVLTAGPADAVDPQALAQEQEYVGAGCLVEVLQAKAVLWGNNGFRIEHWNVRTRDGIARFEVSYHPSAILPSSANPYSVRGTDATGEAQPQGRPCLPSSTLGSNNPG